MIYWLVCLLFCIQSYASPLPREKHHVLNRHLYHMEPGSGHRNEFHHIHFRRTGLTSNNKSNPHFLIRSSNITQDPNVSKEDSRFSSRIAEVAAPKVNAYGSRQKKHHFSNWKYGHAPTKEVMNGNDKLESSASTNGQTKRKTSDHTNRLTQSSFEPKVNQNSGMDDDILKRSQTGGIRQIGGNGDNEEVEKISANIGALNRDVESGASHRHNPQKKNKPMKHMLAGSGLNSQEKKHIPKISQPFENLSTQRSAKEISKPSLNEDMPDDQRFSEAKMEKGTNSMISPSVNKNFEQTDQQHPIKKDKTNISEDSEDYNESPEEQSSQTDRSDRQLDESFLGRSTEHTDEPLDYDYEQTTQKGQDSSEVSAGESTDLYKPINFKLRDESKSSGRSTFTLNETEDPNVTKQIESKDVKNDLDVYPDEEINSFENGTDFYPQADDILTTFIPEQPSTVNDSTTHILKKKSSNSENFHKMTLRSRDNHQNNYVRNRKSSLAHKRSHQRKISSNGNSLIAKRNNDMSDFKSYSMESKIPKNSNFKLLLKKDLHNKSDGETETSTSIIQTYAFPTLGLSDKIMKSVSESRKRSSTDKRFPNHSTFQATLTHFKSSPSDNMDKPETKSRSTFKNKTPLFQNKVSRKVNESISSTPYPHQANETDQPDKVLRNVPNKEDLSKRNQNDVVDTVTRTKEKSIKTIVTDGQDDKETNIIENKEEKVIDRIQVKKQPLASSQGAQNQVVNDDSGKFSEENDYGENEYENEDNVDNVSPESDVVGPSNNFKTNKVQQTHSKEDYRDTTSQANLSNKLKSTSKLVSPPDQPKPNPNPNNAQYPKNANKFNEKEIAKEFENLEPPKEDEYSYEEESGDENQPGGQSSFSDYDKANGPEQSTNDFIELGEQEKKKDRVLEDLDEFPSAKQNNRNENYQSNFGSESRSQKGNFYEFSTVLPDLKDMGEFHREEKVERQSKVVHKNHGMMTNGSSSLFGEKKIEVKDNKQNFHETFMEERGESKFPAETENETESGQPELRKRDHQNSMSQNEVDYQNPMSTKNKKNIRFDDSYDQYDYEEEDDSDSDTEDSNENEGEDEYLIEPNDVLQSERRIDGISKRSGAFIDISKLMNNSQNLESNEQPGNVPQLNSKREEETSGNSLLTSTMSDEEPDKNREHRIRTSNKNSNDSTQITNRQIEAENPRSNSSEKGSNEKLENGLVEGNKREDAAVNASTENVTSGSGNIVYVTLASTTDQDSQFNDFLNIQDESRQSRQLPRHQENIYHRQRKHLSPNHKADRFSANYRTSRNAKQN